MAYILIFNSVHKVMKAEKLLKEAKLESKTIPVPRKLSSDCGLAIRINKTSIENILTALEKEKPDEVYIEKMENYEKIYEKEEDISN
ncbi:MAG: DUF3343 domain-containing protein [Proteobacteria bacterium]|nr:DUF3343 domain-containing protein [Pseudomonadota bacterium]